MAKIKFGMLILCSLLVAGCAVSTQITKTPRSGIEQELLVSSLRRGLAALDTEGLKGATVTVEFYGLTPDKDFAKEFLIAWLQAQQVQIVTNPKDAQLRLKVFASVLAVDQAQSFIGSPSFTVPFIGITIPEIPLFRNVRHSGYAALESYTIDEDTGKFLNKSPPAIGRTEHNDYTLLIVVHFTQSDVEHREWDWRAF